MKKEPNSFHLGLTMAGAVSAGAYTAGFIDYLLEALNAWQNEKDKHNVNSEIPNHNVVIDAIGGASAGGMVSMITTLALLDGGLKPVLELSHKKTGNILYDSWVFLDDDDELYNGGNRGLTTFQKMLKTDDIKSKEGAPSLLNSTPINNIADRVFNSLPNTANKENLPNYISKDLRLLLTITSLRPLDYKVNLSRLKSKFLDATPGHRISNHDIVAHFKLNYNETLDKDQYLPFRPLSPSVDPKSNREFLKNITLATGAFPVGLKPQFFNKEFTTNYVRNNLKKRKDFTSKMDLEFESSKSKYFQFTAIDGGTINNEPFDEVLRCLVDRYGAENTKNPKYGTILIDPFPNFKDEIINPSSQYKKSNIMDIVGYLVPAILNQARNKQSDTYGLGIFKLMAFPRKLKLGNIEEEVEHPPLATGAIGGFGGFIDIAFRKHDFFLGRKNAQNFLRGLFFAECNPEDEENLFYGVSEASIKAFSREVDGKLYMPIIPDVNKLDPNDDPNPTKYVVQDFPIFNEEGFRNHKKSIKKRVSAILKAELNGKINSWYLKIVVWLFRNKLASSITDWTVETIVKDFKKRGM